MQNKFLYKTASMLLLLAMLSACGQQGATPTTAQGRPDSPDENGKDKVEITLNRTPTPVMDPDDIPMYVDKPNPNPPSPDQPSESILRGDGEQLEGYTQLLQYVDRSKISGPGGWGTHPVGDMFDGCFETTDDGSNKYGHNGGGAFEVTWKMVESVTLSAYTLYTANDTESYPDRNPKEWKILGSEDGEEWVELDHVTDGDLPVANYASKTFTMKNDTAYRYYKWDVLETVGGGFQISEMLLYTSEDISEIPPVKPPIGVGEFEGTLPAQGLAATGKEAEPIIGEDAINWMNDHKCLNAKTDILSAYVSVSCWGDNEGPDKLFDIDCSEKFSMESFAGMHNGKLGCGTPEGAYIVVQTKDAIAPDAYVFVTGNDTSTYPDRNPVQWVLYGSTDGNTWVALDQVQAGNMAGEDYTPHVYTMENTKQYNWFCLSVENVGSLQLCDILFFQQ